MSHLTKRFKKSSNIVDRLIDDEVIIIPINSKLSSQSYVYNLDPAGAKIWQLIDGKNTVANIREHMTETTDVTCEQAEGDLIEFLKDLESAGVIEEIR